MVANSWDLQCTHCNQPCPPPEREPGRVRSKEGSLRPLHFGTGGALGRNTGTQHPIAGAPSLRRRISLRSVAKHLQARSWANSLRPLYYVRVLVDCQLSIPCQRRVRTSNQAGATLEVGDIPISPGRRSTSLLSRPSTSTLSITTPGPTPPPRRDTTVTPLLLRPKHHDSSPAPW
jgi:hypothetical protein